MNTLQLALEAAFKTQQSRRQIPIDKIKGNYKIVDKPDFILPDGSSGACISRKFNSIEDMEKLFSEEKYQYYLYKVCEFDVYDIKLQDTGKNAYTVSYCVREIV